METPVVSVVVPTRNRADYLEVALRSLAEQDLGAPRELLVVDDDSTDETAAVAQRHGARCLRQDGHRGLNAARNAGADAARAPLVAFVDDDVLAPPGWLAALLEGAERHPGADAFGGPIHARLEGSPPGGCGRESAPITTLDLGDRDVEAETVWGANFAVRAAALERVGPFDESWPGCGDEDEWIRRLRAAGGSVVYLAAAGLDHRRAPADARMRPLARGAYRRGRAARENDRRHGEQPTMARELRVLAGCGWHTVRRHCPQGIIMCAHSAGRTLEALRSR